MKISDLRVTPVSVPLEAPIRYSTGADTAIHRLIVEVATDEGLVGLGECCAGAALEARLRESVPALVGADPFRTERLRWQLGSPAEAKLFGNVNHTYAALEFACLDIRGQVLGRPVHDLLGGRLRDCVPLIGYLFYRHPNERGWGAVDDVERMLAFADQLVDQHGFTTLKFKAGVRPPEEELGMARALREHFPRHRLRVDPNAAWSVSTAVRMARKMRRLDLEYLEDPTWGVRAMARVSRQCPGLPLASNMAIATAEDIALVPLLDVVDVVLLDPHFYGGLRQARHAAGALEILNVGVALHSQGELGISLAAQLHLAASLPGFVHAADAHYHHVTDDVLEGGKLPVADGAMRVPTGPGLGVRLDRERLENYRRLAGQLQTAAQTSMTGDPHGAGHVPVLPRW